MKNKEKISSLTYAAMMAAIFIVFHLIFPAERNIQGVIGTITPIPIAIYCFTKDYKKNIILCLACLLLSLCFFDTIMVVSFVLPSLIFGMTLGTVLKKKFSWLKFLLLAGLNIGFNLYEIYINYLITDINFIEINLASINTGISAIKEFFPTINEKILFDLNIGLLPLMIIAGGISKTIIAFYLTKIAVGRLFNEKIEHKEFDYYLSSSIYVEIIVLGMYLFTGIIWCLFLLNFVGYYAIYSFLLDIALFVSLIYFIMVYKGITRKFKQSKLKYGLVSLMLLCGFVVVSPLVALKRIIKRSKRA